MNDKKTVRRIYKQEDIFYILTKCGDSFYNQNYNNPHTLDILSGKFANSGVFLCAYLNDSPAGFSAFYCNDTNTKIGFLSMIIIKNEYQKMGIGSLLLEKTFSVCKKQQMSAIRLKVAKTNNNAISFYKKADFRFLDCDDTLSFLMEKDIST